MASQAATGRKSAPRALKLLGGIAPGRDSGGRKVAAAVPFERGAVTKPKDLSSDAAWLWDQVVAQMHTVGLLKPLDAASLEVVCETFARWREAVAFRRAHALLAKNSQGTVAAPWVGIEERASRDFRAWCAEYGLTPAAEKNLASGDESNGDDKENPFE
jgi:P27 family predicted phage terminase small subunit